VDAQRSLDTRSRRRSGCRFCARSDCPDRRMGRETAYHGGAGACGSWLPSNGTSGMQLSSGRRATFRRVNASEGSSGSRRSSLLGMAESTLLVCLPANDRQALIDLERLIPQAILSDSRGIDGAALVQVLVPVSAGALAVLRSWIMARATTRQNIELVVNGHRFRGLSADELERLLRQLAEEPLTAERPPGQTGDSSSSAR
jgi:hypothetical protein